jgi:penicillin-binding protein-related factor A (putative recombinase)
VARNKFEAEVARSASLLGLIYYKIAVPQKGHIKLRSSPYDGFFVEGGRHIAVEWKSLGTFRTFPLSEVKPHQVEGLSRILQEGCDAFLVVNLRGRPLRSWFLHFSEWDSLLQSLNGRKSVPVDWFLKGCPFLHEIPRIHVLDDQKRKQLVWDVATIVKYRTSERK